MNTFKSSMYSEVEELFNKKAGEGQKVCHRKTI